MNPTQTKNMPTDHGPHCIWMQAGVVHQKFCRINFDCTACHFDRAMRRTALDNRRLNEQGITPKGKKGKIVFWKDRLRERPSWKRPCLHSMKGRIDFRACTNDYQCGNCEFDQYFSDQFAVHAVVRPVDVLDIKGFKIPQGYYLHRGHCWVKIEEGATVRVGLDDFALRLLGPLDRIEAPLMGKEIQQDRADIALTRGEHAARVLSPVSGVVTDINPELREEGSLANREPYTEGWVLRLHSNSLRADIRNLMFGNQAGDYLNQEVDRLYDVIENEAGPLAADGGYLGDDIFGNLPQVEWRKLTQLFLHT